MIQIAGVIMLSAHNLSNGRTGAILSGWHIIAGDAGKIIGNLQAKLRLKRGQVR
jgi:hypothetical protein